MPIFEINVIGWETYIPRWVEKKCTVKHFVDSVKKAIVKSSKEILSGDDFISGEKLQNVILKYLKKNGFVEFHPCHTIGLGGEIYYVEDGCHKRPKIIPKDIWKKIIKHNENIHNGIEDECRKRLEIEEEKKKETG